MSKEKDFIPPSQSFRVAIDAMEDAYNAILKANAEFRRGIGNDGHGGHIAISHLFDRLENVKNMMIKERVHHALQEENNE
jgi:hypothetical protein